MKILMLIIAHLLWGLIWGIIAFGAVGFGMVMCGFGGTTCLIGGAAMGVLATVVTALPCD